MQETKKVLGAIHRHYDLLMGMMPSPTEGVGTMPMFTLSDLQNSSGKDIGYLSRLADKLVKLGILVESEKPKEGGGRPYRVLSLSPLGFKLLNAIKEATKPPEETKILVDPWKIEECINLIEEDLWSEDIRYKFANELFELVRYDPVQALEKSSVLKKRFEEWVANPPTDEKVGERIRATISNSLPRLLQSQSTRAWVLNQLYPKILKLFNHSNPAIKLLAIGLLVNIAINTDRRKEVGELFLNHLLTKTLEELRQDKLTRETLIQLSGIVGGLNKDQKKSLLDDLKAKAKLNEDMKQKVEYILDTLMTSILA